MALILDDIYDIYLRNGARATVHAKSLVATQDPSGAYTSIIVTNHDGIASALHSVDHREVVAIVQRREQGTLCTMRRLAGDARYREEAGKSIVDTRDIPEDKPAPEIVEVM